MKRKICVSVVLIVIIALVGSCVPKPAAVVPTEKPAAPATEKLTVGMVTSGSLGDNGIFDLSLAGLERAKTELGIDFKVLEGKEDPSLYFNLLETAAQSYKLVIVNPGYQFSEPLKEIAPKYPGTTFIYMDGVSDIVGANISSMATSDHEGSYLAGILAAGMTTLTDVKGINADKEVGLVGAIDAPVINNFIAGFKNGVASVDPGIKVNVLYAGAFDNPAKGKELATSLYSQKSDIVYNVASQTGQGILLAAKETGHYAIGVDTDQCAIQPGSILASMLKRFDNTTFLMVEAMSKGELKGGQAYSYGLKEGGVELRMCAETKDIVPADLVAKINDANAKIISGEIKVDSLK
jgi:basic membrane protein A